MLLHLRVKTCEDERMERPEQPPEGRLIAAALDKSGLSIREASRRAGISYGRWRQIVNGFVSLGKGQYGAVQGPAKTVARMAQAVGIHPAQLDDAGRPDAADALAKALAESPGEPSPDDVAEQHLLDPSGASAEAWRRETTAQERRMVLAFFQAMRSNEERERNHAQQERRYGT